MPKVIEVIYENGVFKPLEKVDLKEGERLKIRIEDVDSIVNEAFGLLKGKDTLKALRELEDEWGVC
ncbi:antitoxin [Archaeoglobales archaeon]|nr:MAG: antitoxin [Archaeoglobales archaeon]